MLFSLLFIREINIKLLMHARKGFESESEKGTVRKLHTPVTQKSNCRTILKSAPSVLILKSELDVSDSEIRHIYDVQSRLYYTNMTSVWGFYQE